MRSEGLMTTREVVRYWNTGMNEISGDRGATSSYSENYATHGVPGSPKLGWNWNSVRLLHQRICGKTYCGVCSASLLSSTPGIRVCSPGGLSTEHPLRPSNRAIAYRTKVLQALSKIPEFKDEPVQFGHVCPRPSPPSRPTARTIVS